MTPVNISDRILIPVYDMGDELYEALYDLSLIEGDVYEGVTTWLEST